MPMKEMPADFLTNAPGYPKVVKEALQEMHRQVGDLDVDRQGIARRGLLIRHLVLPNNLAHTEEILRFIAQEISQESYVNIMDQYRPCFKAPNFAELAMPITQQQYSDALNMARSLGLHRGF